MLKTPPLLAGAALLFWGWQTGFLFFAGIMAVMVEASRFTNARWEFSQTDYNRIWNLCAILFLGVAVYCFASNDGAEAVSGMFGTFAKRTAALLKTTRSVLLLFQWLPVIFFPVIAAQSYGFREKIDFSTFSWLLRRRLARGAGLPMPKNPNPGLNVSFVYFGLCLFASCAEKNESAWFYPGLGFLIGWALFTQRPKCSSGPAWCVVMLMVAGLGFGAQFGLRQVHQLIAQLDSVLFSRYGRGAFNARETETSIGSIGKLNLSGRIMFRLESERGDFPGYLREASYNLFRSPTWHATRRNFSGLVSETNDTTWELLPGKDSRHSVSIAHSLARGRGLLALPTGVSVLEKLPVALETNRFGAALAQSGPPFVDFIARYDLGKTIDSAPDDDDLAIVPAKEAAVSQVARELDLHIGMDLDEALRKTAAFFRNEFEYSTYLTAEGFGSTNETALARFLLRKRSGHCEYFATATTLLLRKAGIPTRYAVGYSVQEIRLNKAVVRERHAHAWCLFANRDGIWQDFDTTPASWSEIEGRHARFWEPISDAWSRLWFEFSRWRYGKTSFRRYIPWIVTPMVVLLIAQLLLRKRSTRSAQSHSSNDRTVWPGLDSEFYKIDRALSARGFARQSGETSAQWLSRIRSSLPSLIDCLPEILRLHYRHRFDPAGLNAAGRQQLSELVESWIAAEQASARHAIK